MITWKQYIIVLNHKVITIRNVKQIYQFVWHELSIKLDSVGFLYSINPYYFPIQKSRKIESNRSSVVISPVISPKKYKD